MDTMTRFLAAACLAGFLGCGGSASQSADGGDGDGFADGDGGGDIGSGDGGLSLRVPAGTALCNTNYESPSLEILFPKIRLTLKAGDFPLPTSAGETPLDLLERVEVGGAGVEAAAAGPGTIILAVQHEPPHPAYCAYAYRQPFRLGAQTLDIRFDFWRECRDDGAVPFPAGVTLQLPHYPCGDTAKFTTGAVNATAQNGDTVRFEFFFADACALFPPFSAGICPANHGDPSLGRFNRASDTRAVNDYFGLALSCMHHGGPAFFVMMFDTPLGEIYGVSLDTVSYQPARFQYLDASMEILSSSDAVSVTYE
jgi:hypothetical protein